MNSALWAAAVTGLAGAVVGREHQDQARQLAGDKWQDNDLVFASGVGTALDAANVHRSFRKVIAAAGLDPAEWTPRELRHSFVSLLSDAGVPIEKIARLVGHSGTATTEIQKTINSIGDPVTNS